MGLPLQLWMVGVGVMLVREHYQRAHVLPPQMRTPVPRRQVVDARTGEPLPIERMGGSSGQ